MNHIRRLVKRWPTLQVTAFMAVLVALVIGFALGRYRMYAFQNRDQARLCRAPKRRFVSPGHLLDLKPRQNDGITQIDHVLVSRLGIFVMETKDYKGWIFARRDDCFGSPYM